jgi:hypothetical protein
MTVISCASAPFPRIGMPEEMMLKGLSAVVFMGWFMGRSVLIDRIS